MSEPEPPTETSPKRFCGCCCILNVATEPDPPPPPPPSSRSVDLKVKLPVTDTISRFYAPQKNRIAIRVLTVTVYILCVSMAAIILSIYYVFVWDPEIQPVKPTARPCDKVVIPEFIAIRLVNSTEITAEQFYKNLAEFYHQFVHDKTNASNLKNKSSQKHETQKLPSSLDYDIEKHINYSRVATLFETMTPIPTEIITTTETIPMLENYQRTFLNRLKNQKDDDVDNYQDFDDSEQYSDTQNTENVYTDENYDTKNYATYR